MEWSPQHAMEAYLQSLQLKSRGRTSVTEPRSLELISALAAGKRSRLIIEISSEGVTPLTIALAASAKLAGGRLVCFVHEDEDAEKCRGQLRYHGVDRVTDIVTKNPCEVTKHLKNIDFVVIDFRFGEVLRLLSGINLSPGLSYIAITNLPSRRERKIAFCDVVQVREGGRCVTLPFGEGVELIRVDSRKKCESRRCKRFYVTFESSKTLLSYKN